ncbi:AAA domain-containing protein [Burkholderia multivorans]
MNVTQEIAAWANAQSDWISDAVRRLLEKGTLSPDDVADIAALIKEEAGVAAPENRTAQKLDMASLPTSERGGDDISLLSIRAPENLNAIQTADGISFEPDGLTIVYGHNGAGKSGYARALKKACRARNSETIIPNVFAPPAQISPTRAQFEWRAGTTTQSGSWTDGTKSLEPLSKIAVFDSHCARVFIDDQAEVLYVPYGMDILRDLAGALQATQKLLEAEQNATKFDMTKLSSLAGGTKVGKLLSSLSHTTDPKTAEQLAVLSDDEKTELSELTKLIREEDPTKKATTLRRFATRIQAVESELATLQAPLLDDHIGKLRTAFEQLVAAEAAAKLAATALQEDGKALPGTGTDPWEVLVRSAMKFATETAYPGHPFPGPLGSTSCVLCQQPLSAEASKRLQDFAKFLETDAQQQFTQTRKVTVELYKAIVNTNIDSFPSDKVFLDEVAELAPEAAGTTRVYLAALKTRQAEVKVMAPNRRIDTVSAPPTSPAQALKTMRESCIAQAEKLEKTLTPEERSVKTARLADLEARIKLQPLLPTVLEAIAALKYKHALSEAIKRCNTSSITRKITELYEKYVTAELRAALESELRGLGLGATKIGLEMTGQKGARMQQLKLTTTPRFAKVRLSDILSEGEQRAIALASFLGEIAIEPGKSGIVFDDPVSSLDHMRRERIANRLALEAKSRQVIVFTHDLAFAWSLKEFAEKHGANHTERHVYAAGDQKGLCSDALPFEAKRLDARVNDLRTLANRAKKALEQDQDYATYNDMIRNGYRRMRDTWELLIEDLLFAGTVKRFRRSVETRKLRYVVVEDTDVKAVYEGMTRCSNFTHEGGAEAPPTLPQPDEFLADVESLATAVTTIKAREKSVEQRRAAAGITS